LGRTPLLWGFMVQRFGERTLCVCLLFICPAVGLRGRFFLSLFSRCRRCVGELVCGLGYFKVFVKRALSVIMQKSGAAMRQNGVPAYTSFFFLNNGRWSRRAAWKDPIHHRAFAVRSYGKADGLGPIGCPERVGGVFEVLPVKVARSTVEPTPSKKGLSSMVVERLVFRCGEKLPGRELNPGHPLDRRVY
jgi:hypothetical protein